MTIVNTPKYYIGLMSGTSADGIDLALVTFDNLNQPNMLASYYQPYSAAMTKKIVSLYSSLNNTADNSPDNS